MLMKQTAYDAQGRELFNQKAADSFQPPNNPKGEPMRRVFVEWADFHDGVQVVVRPQVWQGPNASIRGMDAWQEHCMRQAEKMALASDEPVLYYHTRAWRVNPAI